MSTRKSTNLACSLQVCMSSMRMSSITPTSSAPLRSGDSQRAHCDRERHLRRRHRHPGRPHRAARLRAARRRARDRCRRRVVTPGGVDAHCHLDQPMAAAGAHGRRLRHRHARRRLRRHDHGDPVRRAGEGPVAARRGARLPRARRRPRARRPCLPPDRQRSHRGGAEERTAAADRRGLHLVQDLHDLRRPQARRRPDPRRARCRAPATARWR